MPVPPLPPEIEEFLRKPNPAVVATIRPDGSPHSVATWYDLVDGLILLNMAATRARLAHIRRDPRVSLTVLDVDDWYTHVTVHGVVERLEGDSELADIEARAALPGPPLPQPRGGAGQRVDALRALVPLGLSRVIPPSRTWRVARAA